MILNPRTNRQMKIGSSSHKKAVREGYMSPDTLQIYTPNEPEKKEYKNDPDVIDYISKLKPIEPEPHVDNFITKLKNKKPESPKIDDSFTTEQGVAEICTDIISENKQKFKKLSQAETDELLRKLLYKKLYGDKPKPDKKSKLKVKKAYSSSDSD